MTAEVVALSVCNSADVTASLRQLANRIEAGHFGPITSLAFAFQSDDGFYANVLGEQDYLVGIAIADLAKEKFRQIVLGGDDE